MTARLQEKYKVETIPALNERFQYPNVMAVPRLMKIVVTMGIGDAQANTNRLDEAQKHLERLTGQKAVVTKARRAVSNFKVREGYKVGLKVTLRGQRMWEFMDRLVHLAIPRVKDFRGLKPRLDGRGNYSMGLDEQTVFPEIDPGNVTFTQGMNITFTTTAKTDEEARELLGLLGMPFRKES